MEKFGFHWSDLYEILYLSIFRKSVEKLQISLKSDNNNGYLIIKNNIYFWSHLPQFFLEEKDVSDKFVEEIKTHFEG
jgi:hypothetical protein